MLKANLRRIAKHIAHWTVPPGVQEVLYDRVTGHRKTYVTSRLTMRERVILEKNRALCNLHAGERCFILATGPSIRRQNLKLLRGETCFGVSNFFVHPDYHYIKPRYYCIAPYHPPITEAAWQKWMDELDRAVTDATIFFGITDKERNERKGRFCRRNSYYLKFGKVPNLDFDIDLTKTLPGPKSVPVMAIMLAIYMGFQQIYLLGCDHDWIIHMNESRHFYDEHHHALNNAGYNEWIGTDVESTCSDYIHLWKQYKSILRIARSKSVEILNSTPGGMLDVFKRVPLESIGLAKAVDAANVDKDTEVSRRQIA